MNDTEITIGGMRAGSLPRHDADPQAAACTSSRSSPPPTRSWWDPAIAAKGSIGVSIRPWLRADYPAGGVIEMGSPFGTMRLASDDTGAMELQLSRYGTVTIELVEAF